MKKIIILLLPLCISIAANAAPPVTYQFTNGTTIEASQVNANYQELADRIATSDTTAIVQGLSTDVGVLQSQVLQLQNIQPKQLVGFTAADATSSSDYLALTAQCQLEYPDSRICSTKEIIETVNIPVLSADTSARVAPSGNYSVAIGSGALRVYEGFAGPVSDNTEEYLNSVSGCLRYSTGSGFSANCNSGPKVACCR